MNDVSCGRSMHRNDAVVAALNVPYVCMHAKGTPENMQENPVYENVTGEVLDFFIENTIDVNRPASKTLSLILVLDLVKQFNTISNC